ncbi:uncharacterized protein LOC116341539 [Contarinia nasturtii]|uniref:uncharacterized protein LOC116341539 n=1 Tax=Contarinia nasturtii TaxID=265458 RepID=UPI0012D4183C|nr:uncharacterized protein LOC116341539 [Contarinia nasturtii]
MSQFKSSEVKVVAAENQLRSTLGHQSELATEGDKQPNELKKDHDGFVMPVVVGAKCMEPINDEARKLENATNTVPSYKMDATLRSILETAEEVILNPAKRRRLDDNGAFLLCRQDTTLNLIQYSTDGENDDGACLYNQDSSNNPTVNFFDDDDDEDEDDDFLDDYIADGIEAVGLFRQDATIGSLQNLLQTAANKDNDTAICVSKEQDTAVSPTQDTIDEDDNGAVGLVKQDTTLGSIPNTTDGDDNGVVYLSKQDTPRILEEDFSNDDDDDDGGAVSLFKQDATLTLDSLKQPELQKPATKEWCKFSNVFIKKIGPIIQSGKVRHSRASGWVYDKDYLHNSSTPMDNRRRAAERLMQSSLLFLEKLDEMNATQPKKKYKKFSELKFKNGVQCVDRRLYAVHKRRREQH